MKKRTLICECGQEMLVPESALGRSGLCPACGETLAIREENTRPWEEPKAPAVRANGRLMAFRDRHKVEVNNETREASWRKFAEAVDLYNSRRFAEALTLLNQLEEAFPGNPHIAEAREQCIEALEEGMAERKEYDGRPIQSNALNGDLVQALILDKMLRGATEEVQLQATELAARMLGMLPQNAPQANEPMLAPPPSPFLLGGHEASASQAPEGDAPNPAPRGGRSKGRGTGGRGRKKGSGAATGKRRRKPS